MHFISSFDYEIRRQHYNDIVHHAEIYRLARTIQGDLPKTEQSHNLLPTSQWQRLKTRLMSRCTPISIQLYLLKRNHG